MCSDRVDDRPGYRRPSCEVDDRVDAVRCLGESVSVEDRPDDQIRIDTFQVRRIAGTQVVDADHVSGRRQALGDMRPDESGHAGDEHSHGENRTCRRAAYEGHLGKIVALEPAAWPRTFTLKELGRAALRVGLAGGDVAGWVARASEGRKAADLMVPSDDDDLSDPYGRDRRYHDEMVRQVDDLTRAIARALAS